MAYLDDIRLYDYLHWENPQSVEVAFIREAGTDRKETDYAFRMDATKARVIFGGVSLTNDERSWILPANELIVDSEQFDPRPGDTITEVDDTVWTINRVQKVRNDSQFVVTAIKQVE